MLLVWCMQQQLLVVMLSALDRFKSHVQSLCRLASLHWVCTEGVALRTYSNVVECTEGALRTYSNVVECTEGGS